MFLWFTHTRHVSCVMCCSDQHNHTTTMLNLNTTTRRQDEGPHLVVVLMVNRVIVMLCSTQHRPDGNTTTTDRPRHASVKTTHRQDVKTTRTQINEMPLWVRSKRPHRDADHFHHPPLTKQPPHLPVPPTLLSLLTQPHATC